MLMPRIQQHFIDGADVQYQCAQALGAPLEAAAQVLLHGLTAGGKVLAWGQGVAAALAQALVAQLVGRFERERPELAALVLGADATLASVATVGDVAAAAAVRQLRALGLPGDVLLLVCAGPPGPDALALVDTAHERDIAVVVLSGARVGDLPDALRDGDVWAAVPAERAPRVLEAQLVALHALCDALDAQLLGDDELETVTT
ncbi:MAG: SIS domain-containing protein [Tepidimonas ignava]|jgi:D-sedoheptulose 7-phosphate isomerase|uniref:Phosphoheptose isomerase n=1 Tax=Tepidimonas ignava TaxID=114249 RepID=A0A4R3LJQ1_9BURK|nr:SIS domain-containing protein [Tepidimonas ignava]MCX7814696.1 SIS domain-containing protein [Tepidimonas ignava]TCS97906.1 phosphoheptose isomerase [Tepidimonas ignava]TSE23768.1 Phosphoheptose isomerase [Tepidimonas ignava]